MDCLCEICGEECDTANIETYEISGKIVCDDCADEIFEENSQS
jgi:ribosome-binding protein aMBF1 (putative translation factor)